MHGWSSFLFTNLSSHPPPPFWEFSNGGRPRYRKYWTSSSTSIDNTKLDPAQLKFLNDPTHTWPRARALKKKKSKMKLTDEVFRSFRVSKVFRENTDRVNCIDFSANGEHMISSSNDDSIVVYCCQEGRCALNRKTTSLKLTIVYMSHHA